jgi:hypothetical protein
MTPRANERRAFDVVTGPDGPRHGFIVELPDGTLSPRKDWVAIGLNGDETDGQPGFRWLGRFKTPREAYAAILNSEDPRLLDLPGGPPLTLTELVERHQ